MNPPRLPAIAGGWTERSIPCGMHTVRLAVPADPDALLDDPATVAANESDDYMPYWAYLWPAAVEMAEMVSRIDIPHGAAVVELGSGLGLVGIASLLCGQQATLSDYREEPVNVARYNCLLNGVQDPQVELIDWRQTPPRKYDVILACDVLYEVKDHGPLLAFIDQILSENGVAWIGDPGRQRADEFTAMLPSQFTATVFDARLSEISKSHTGFRLIRIEKST